MRHGLSRLTFVGCTLAATLAFVGLHAPTASAEAVDG